MKQIRVTTDQIKCPEIKKDKYGFPIITITVGKTQLELDWYAADLIYRQMQKYYAKEDLANVLEELELDEDNKGITEKLEPFTDDILEKYRQYRDESGSWFKDMEEAIDYVRDGEDL